MNPEELALLIPLFALSIPIFAIVTKHLQKIAEIKARTGGNVPANVEAELTALRNEVAALRDTTTRFDMSFDAAITRLEDRMETVETKQTGTVSGAPAYNNYQNGNNGGGGANETATLRQRMGQ